jgi:hypothetical protein
MRVKKTPQVAPSIPQKVVSERVSIIETAPASGGKTKLLEYLHGAILTRGNSIKAKCCECMGYYVDGRYSCEIPTCPLFYYMPYKNKKPPQVKED